MNCTAVTASTSHPCSSRGCATVTAADIATDARTSASPPAVAPPPLPAATMATPASETAKPAHASGGAGARCHAAASTATSTGAVPMSSDACVTLVRSTPAFCTRTVPPHPAAPAARTGQRNARRSSSRRAMASMTRAARPKRAAASHPGSSQPRAIFDSGTLVPHAEPAAASAARARLLLLIMGP